MRGRLIFSIFGFLTLLASILYLLVRIVLFLEAHYNPFDRSVALVLLLAEVFVLIHSIGYFLNIFTLSRSSATEVPPPPVLRDFPPVAIVVSSFREPIHVVEDTLICFRNLTYPNCQIYFLDDTRYDGPSAASPEYRAEVDAMCQRLEVNLFRRSWRGAKAGMLNDFLSYVAGGRDGFELSFFGRRRELPKPKYMIVFDADMNPFPDFVEPLVALLEANPRLAFIQTPQYYSNFETNRVARASGLQQAVFYEYICEGKSLKNAMFCCGTNVVFRTEALEDVGGLDELSVTEDFATSLKFHMKGWSSLYVNRVSAFGMGPEDLSGFFKQQFRWALGTVGLLRKIVVTFIRNPRALPAATWWEYLLSGSHYFVGWVFLIMSMCPILYLFFGIPTYFVHPEFYLLFFAPYLILSFLVFFWTLGARRYSFQDLYLGMLLTPISFPVYAKASLYALFGVKGKFTVTPKGGGSSLPLLSLWPQLLLALLSFAAVIWGLHRAYYEGENVRAVLLNCFWCSYFFAVLSGVLYFNNPEEKVT